MPTRLLQSSLAQGLFPATRPLTPVPFPSGDGKGSLSPSGEGPGMRAMRARALSFICGLCLALLGAACQGQPAAPTLLPSTTATSAQTATVPAPVETWAVATGTALRLTALAAATPAAATATLVPLATLLPAIETAGVPLTPSPTDTAPTPLSTRVPPSATLRATQASSPRPVVSVPTVAAPVFSTLGPVPSAPVAVPTAVGPTPCAFAWFMTPAPTACAGQAPVYSLTVAEHFQHGVMIWRQTPDVFGSRIYAFFDDNQWPYFNPSNDAWYSGDPESDPTLTPPAGLFQPVRGFGVFWRQAYFGAAVGAARDRLGWATDAEFSLGSLPMQCRPGDPRNYGCYLAGPDHLIYDLEAGNRWSLWPAKP
jgi:hypothetical protein